MKELALNEMNSIKGGDFEQGFCVGVAVASLFAAITPIGWLAIGYCVGVAARDLIN